MMTQQEIKHIKYLALNPDKDLFEQIKHADLIALYKKCADEGSANPEIRMGLMLLSPKE